MEWQTLTFKDCKDESEDDRKTLSRLLTRAMQLQSQLEQRYHSDEFLKDMLLRATAREQFAANIHLNTPKTSSELIERMNLSIDAQSRIQNASLAASRKEEKSKSTGVTAAFADEFFIRRPAAEGRSKMYNRRYGNPRRNSRGVRRPIMHSSRSSGNGRKNPIDRHTGEVMRCRSCGSDTHLLRQCKSASPAQLIHHISAISSDQKDQMNEEDMLDELQNLPDEEWFVDVSEDDGRDIMEDREEDDRQIDSLQDVLYADLADVADKHELCPMNTEEGSKVMYARSEKTDFDGIVMDHGAQNTVGGHKQYEAYCRHTKLQHGPLSPSSKTFKFGNRNAQSLGVATIRFPTDESGG